MDKTVSDVLEFVREMGCDVEEQKSFFKVTGHTPGKAIYVAKTKKALTRIDISGFEPPHHPTIEAYSAEEAKEKRLGAVRGRLIVGEAPPSVVQKGIEKTVKRLLDSQEGFKGRRGTSPRGTTNNIPALSDDGKVSAEDIDRILQETRDKLLSLAK